jgi:hypothetical protein
MVDADLERLAALREEDHQLALPPETLRPALRLDFLLATHLGRDPPEGAVARRLRDLAQPGGVIHGLPRDAEDGGDVQRLPLAAGVLDRRGQPEQLEAGRRSHNAPP